MLLVVPIGLISFIMGDTLLLVKFIETNKFDFIY